MGGERVNVYMMYLGYSLLYVHHILIIGLLLKQQRRHILYFSSTLLVSVDNFIIWQSFFLYYTTRGRTSSATWAKKNILGFFYTEIIIQKIASEGYNFDETRE